ncbi:MAG: hypothetical protein OXI49_17705 [Acidobacteriota bacterium]|nr:hypothetical protein [Acidobacteriota bacterium]
MSEEKPSWAAQTWSAVVVYLGIGFIAASAIGIWQIAKDGDYSLAEATPITTVLADIAVAATAIGVWLEYVRKRRKARLRLPRLDSIEVDAVNDRVALNRLEGRVDTLEKLAS